VAAQGGVEGQGGSFRHLGKVFFKMMRLISNPPFWSKRVFGPVLSILVVTGAVYALFTPHMTREIAGQTPPFIVNLLCAMGAGAAGILALRYTQSLADEVWDAGNELIVCKSGHRERIPLANIIALTHRSGTAPPHSVLTLSTPCRFGRKITFLTILRGAFNWSGPDPAVYDALIVRIHEAQRQALGANTLAR